MRRKTTPGKGPTPGKVKVRKRKQEPENVSGWQEMKKLMEHWSRKKRKWDDETEEAQQSHGVAGRAIGTSDGVGRTGAAQTEQGAVDGRAATPGTRDEQGRGVGWAGAAHAVQCAGSVGGGIEPGTRDEQGPTADIVTVTIFP